MSEQFGAPPPAPSGMSRLTPWMRTVLTGGALAAAALYVLQVGLPDGWRPSSVAGDAAGDTMRHEIIAMREEKIDLERRLADAHAQAQIKGQADLAVIQKALDARTESLAPVSAMAGLADFACMGSQIVSSLSQPQGWGRSSGDDMYYASQKVGAATCGMGNAIRQTVTASQIESVETAAAARGAAMNNGAVQTIATPFAPARSQPQAPVPAAMPILPVQAAPVQPAVQVVAVRPAEPVSLVKASGAAWTPLQQGQLRVLSYRMPVDVLTRINAGLDMRGGYPTIWYDRVAAYQAAHRS